MDQNPYGVTSRDYLVRARKRLNESRREALFYAAFELRCAVESRMQIYLEVWSHISDAQKKGRLISPLGKAIDRHFQQDEIVRIGVSEMFNGQDIGVLYFTPVTRKMRNMAERLGNYLHAVDAKDAPEWWERFRFDLDQLERAVTVANTGTLLGPPMREKKTGQMNMKIEVLLEHPMNSALFAPGHIKLDVKYLKELPEVFEPCAHYWSG